MVSMIIKIVAYLVLAPIIGGLFAGLDRVLSARMQGRKGPSVLQPFYDVLKLTEKEDITVNKVQDFYVYCFLLFVVIMGSIFFAGGDLLMVIFTLTLASVFLIVAAFSSNSPFAQLGAERELLQMMAYEPMVLMTVIGFYMYKGSFNVAEIASTESKMGFVYMIGLFIGFLCILTIKLRKSPFDLSMSHHAHQELVAGLKTEFSGKTYAALEVAHWYENVMLLGLVALFFSNGTVCGQITGAVVAIVAYFFETFVDNNFARMKWQVALKFAWGVAICLGFVNLCVLHFMA